MPAVVSEKLCIYERDGPIAHWLRFCYIYVIICNRTHCARSKCCWSPCWKLLSANW